ncbi:hypothetical protein WJX84_007184 [Apatococcus fuscideae]|uniref:Protein kinase domain-containing protein n=1 Tax=Apatococcus fuscideae TaxID=2026836 RepID=A0AAW1SUT6_9CHLO
MGGQRHSFNNPTWSPEPSSVLPSPCSSFKAQSDAYGEPSQSIWETLQGPWDPSPSWWFSPLESHLEQGKAAPQLAGSPSAASTPQANACSEDPCVSLLEVLRHHGGPLPEALAWAAVEEAAGTLQNLHDADLVHGAVSLETISLDGSVKARLHGIENACQLSVDGSSQQQGLCADPNFAPPEIVWARHGPFRLTPAADMWSLGAVLLSLLRGSSLPFDPPGLGSTRFHASMLPDGLQAWLDGRLERLQSSQPALVPAGAACVVKALLRADPAQRATAAQICKSGWLASRPAPLSSPNDKVPKLLDVEDTESLFTWNTVEGAADAMGHLWLQPEGAAASVSGSGPSDVHPSFMREPREEADNKTGLLD